MITIPPTPCLTPRAPRAGCARGAWAAGSGGLILRKKAMDIDEILLEDARRRAVPRPVFDPLRGDADDPDRVEVSTPLKELPRARVPRTMVEDPQYDLVRADPLAWELLRCRHDFAYWCVRVARIKPKDGFGQVPFVLNYPQRKLLAVMEADRLAGRPIRVILLKSRQWGGSTPCYLLIYLHIAEI